MNFMRRHPITTYFLLTGFISWVLGIPWVIIMSEIQSNSFVSDFLMRFGPSLAGLLTAWIVMGKVGLKDLLSRTFSLRGIPLWMYAYILIVPSAIFYISLLMMGYGEQLQTLTIGTILGTFAIQFLIHSFIAGGLSEEIGWRGFMLPHLSKKFSPLMASILIAIPWILWHWPVFLLGDGGLSDLGPFMVLGLSLSIVLTWVYFRTGGNILVAVLLHGSFNAGTYTLEKLLPHIPETEGFTPAFDWTLGAFWTLIAILTVVIFKSQLGKVPLEDSRRQ